MELAQALAGRVADDEAGLVAADPRLALLGWRAIVAAAEAAEFADTPAEAYHTRRIAMGVPEGGRDFLFGEAFPHEALMDQLHGVDFDKGCYVGQEVVSRMLRRMVGGGPGAGIDRLSDRELEVFQWIGHGLSVGEIAEKLKVSPKTIETYRAHIKEKLGLASASDVLRVAVTWLEQKT